MPQVTAEMLRRGRNIAEQDADLKAERDGLIFMETSPKQEPIVLYAMADGEPIPMAPNIAEMAIKKKYRGGGYLFTDKAEEAPQYKLGEIKCFLHPQSPERLSGALDEVGIASAVCHSEHLASKYARRVHAENRHGKRWQALQEHLAEIKQQEYERRQQAQLDATLALAGRAATVTVEAKPIEETPTVGLSAQIVEVLYDCPDCDWQPKKSSERPAIALAGHRREKHKEKADGALAE